MENKSQYITSREYMEVFSEELGDIVLPPLTILQFLADVGIDKAYAIEQLPADYVPKNGAVVLKPGHQIRLTIQEVKRFVKVKSPNN